MEKTVSGEEKAGESWLEYIKQFKSLEDFWNAIPEPTNCWLRQQVDIYAGKYPKTSPPPDTDKKAMEESVIRRAIHALEYCAFNYDETTDVDVPDTLVESTGVSDTAILAARELKNLLLTVSQPSNDPTYSDLIAQLKRAEQEIYRLRSELENKQADKKGIVFNPVAHEQSK